MDYMTVTEAAERLGVSRQRVHQLIALGKLSAEFLPPNTWLVARGSVESRVSTPKDRGGRPRRAVSVPG